ncbi:MAG TPA: AMP-binding protein [Acidimicrobiales bacterium]|nr:AMP-binding protein [Acidimicrobiales bacterium]
MTRSEYDTVDQMIRAHQHSDRAGILFEDESYTWRECVQAAASRAAFAIDTKRPGPFHIGFLFENIPGLCLWLAAGAVSGATMVGINPTRQGAELARDITYTDCQLIVTEPRFVEMLHDLDLGLPDDRILVVDTQQYDDTLRPYARASLPAAPVDPNVTALLLFTSGTSGAPKAVITSQGKWARTGRTISMTQNLTEQDVGYMAMPMFHSNALFAGFSPVVYVGGTLALRRRFSASGFLPDIRKFKATYFNYVGKPLTYILATPPSPEDKDHTLRSVFGNEGAERDLRRFSDRFGVPVQDNYGSTESGASVQRVPEQPKGALGRGPEGTVVLDPETLEEKPPAEFDDNGRLLNPDECIGEIVNKSNATSFEGYYKNEEANAQRIRNGWYWSGDLGYRDKDGWFYFAGRDYEWLRVDGENFSAAPIERIVASYPGVILDAVYAVPDEEVGDQVMVALQVEDPSAFDPGAFDEFLRNQSDLGTKWSPRYVRVATELPLTETSKIIKRQLRAQRWQCSDPVYFRPKSGEPLRRMTPDDVESIRAEFAARDRLGELDKV